MAQPIFKLDPGVWFWNALIFGILSIPIKVDCQACPTCNVRQ